MKKKIIRIMLFVFLISSVVQANTISVFAQAISGYYILIVNESLTDAQQSGTINFDDSTANATAGSNNTASYPSKQVDNSVDTRPVTKSYNIGNTKSVSSVNFTVRGIGNKCYIWMDNDTYSMYNETTLATAIADIINVYDTKSYPILKILGADTKMNYADGSGKLSIFLEKSSSSASGYFSPSNMSQDSITGIHIPLTTAITSFGGFGALLAHEGQHALNASTQNFTIWLNEGLSIAAMDMYYDGQDSLNWLNNVMQDLDVKSGAALATPYYTGNNKVDYSNPFLFLRYLNAQANKGFNPNSDFYSKFYSAASNGSGINKDAYIIEQVLKQYDSFKNLDGIYWTFSQSMENFRIAAFKQENTGIYGFYGDTVVKNKIGGPAFYFGQSGKSLTIQPTGAIIIKTNNGSFETPSDAGANIKFIPFNATVSMPTNQANKIFMGGKIDTTIYKNEPITFDDIRIVTTDSNGAYSKIYKNLSELYEQGYSLLALRGFGSANQSNYVLGSNPNDTIVDGDYLFIRKGTGVVNSLSDYGTSVLIGQAKVESMHIVDISKAVLDSINPLSYTGIAQTPDLVVTLNGSLLKKDIDYKVTYSNNVNVGTAKATISGLGTYSGTTSIDFTIFDGRIDISKAVIDSIKPLIFTGTAQTPDLVVTLDGNLLKKDIDYKVTYSNNVNIGTAKATITGLGIYSKTTSINFTIIDGRSAPLIKLAVTLTNNYGAKDVVKITGTFKAGDIIKVYGADSKGKQATTTVSGITLDTDTTTGIDLLNQDFGTIAKGNFYVTYTEKEKTESKPLAVLVSAEPQVNTTFFQKLKDPSDKKSPNVVVNNVVKDTPATFSIASGLADNDVITVYSQNSDKKTYTRIVSSKDTGINLTTTTSSSVSVATALVTDKTMPTNTTTSRAIKFEIPANILNQDKKGDLYYTISKPGIANGSNYVKVSYTTADSPAVNTSNVVVFNDDNATATDLVRVIGLAEGDTVYVLKDSVTAKKFKTTAPTTLSAVTVLGSAKVDTVKKSVTVYLTTPLPPMAVTGSGAKAKIATKGTVWIVVSKSDKKLSKAVSVNYISDGGRSY